MPAERYPASPYFGPLHLPYFQPSGPKNRFFQKPHFLHFWASGPLGNCRGRDLELNGMIGIEIYEILDFFEKFRFWVFLGGLEILAGGSGADAAGFSRV